MRGGWCAGTAWIVIAALLSPRHCAPHTPHLSRAMHCKRLTPSPETDSILYNPAAVQHPRHGWVMLWRYDRCHPHISPNCTELYTVPYVSWLGKQTLPDHSKAAESLKAVAYSKASRTKLRWMKTNEIWLGDMRPFLWEDSIFLAHWVYSETSNPVYILQALSRFDLGTNTLDIWHVFRSLGPKRLERTVQKNWAYLAAGARLNVFYSFLPNTVVASMGPRARVRMEAQLRLDEGQFSRVLEATRLNLSSHVHNSGHPVPWDRGGGAPPEILAMVHQRLDGPEHHYTHWALRMDAASWRVTHVSAGPVLKWSDFRIRGFKDYAVVVGSFHLVGPAATGRRHTTLRVYFGEGDQFSCWEDYNVDALQWLELGQDAYMPLARF